MANGVIMLPVVMLSVASLYVVAPKRYKERQLRQNISKCIQKRLHLIPMIGSTT
jgi:hypothetical protein